MNRNSKALGCHVVVATMDGSYGVKGTVMDAIQAHAITCDFTYSCGPRPMLKAIEAFIKKDICLLKVVWHGIGEGMAFSAKDKQEADLYHRICKEGPVFPIGKVEF